MGLCALRAGLPLDLNYLYDREEILNGETQLQRSYSYKSFKKDFQILLPTVRNELSNKSFRTCTLFFFVHAQ